jgi:DNA (cytosine-5)-methyltransferase 1
MFCEIDEPARRVLAAHFPDVRRRMDVRSIATLPKVDLVAAGFPCQDLSQAGRTAGIDGARSGLVAEVFRLVAKCSTGLRWLLLENVPFMLQLDHGRAMQFLTKALESLGFRWAYRVVDSRAFGIPQRRQRVLLLASRSEDPRGPLLGEDAGPPEDPPSHAGLACGFYWTEGTKGLGWAVDAVPTLKGGSTVGIPSPPAIWLPDGRIVTPEIRDAERLQGFPADWTLAASARRGVKSKGARWKLVGNAVSVPLAEWLGSRLRRPARHDPTRDEELGWHQKWPRAAWGANGKIWQVHVSMWPVRERRTSLANFLRFPVQPLSLRATTGFLSRAERSSLRFPRGLIEAVRAHQRGMLETAVRGTRVAQATGP